MPKSKKPAHDFGKKWRSDDVRLQEQASFESLLLSDIVMKGLDNAGYKIPSPIQLEAIPVGRFGRDLLVQAKSGTGKTLVFTIVALENLKEFKHPQVLIISPTREIALQICDVIKAVGSGFNSLSCHYFIGGIKIEDDAEIIKDCQIVVGTPGRLKHLIHLGILSINSIRLLVLDEFDVMIEPKFKEDIDYIFLSLPKDKQVIATSATFPEELENYTCQYFRRPYLVRLNIDELFLLGMVHYIYPIALSKMSVLAYNAKLKALEKVMSSIKFAQCLVFCNLISRVESLCMDISKWGFSATFISSSVDMSGRIKAISSLKRFRCKVLVSSDLTARGIDAENVDLVVNFDKPINAETYFHRCGRAGRYGSKGVAVTFISLDETLFVETIKHKNFELYSLPDPIPTNLINLRPQECASKVEYQVPSLKEESNQLTDISSQETNNVNSHEENSSGNKEVLKKFCSNSNEAIKDEENSLTASEILNLVPHNVVSDSEILSNGNSNNSDREIPAPNDDFQAKVSYQLSNNSSQKLTVDDLDLTEEYAFNLSEAGCNENVEIISNKKDDQNLNETPHEKQEGEENSSLVSIEKFKDGNIIGELNAADNTFLTQENCSLDEEITNNNSENVLDAFEERYLSLRSNVNEFYLKVYKEYQSEEKDGSMANDIENILGKQCDTNINEFVKKTKAQIISSEKPIKEINVTKHLPVKNTNIHLNDENENEKAKALSLPKSKQNISNKKNTSHSTLSLSESNGNVNGEICFENYNDSENKSFKKHAKYEAKDKKYSGTTSSYSSNSSESLSITGKKKVDLSKLKENEKEGINTLSIKQNKLSTGSYLESDCSKKETLSKEENIQGAKNKIYRSRERSKISSEMSEGENNQPERNFFNKYLNKTHKERKSSNKNKIKPFKVVSDQHQYDQDATYSPVNAHTSSQHRYKRGYKPKNAVNSRCSDHHTPYLSYDFHNDSAFNSYSQQDYPASISYCHPNIPTVGSRKCENKTSHCCYHESHNFHCQHNYIAQWYDEYWKQLEFILGSINSNR